MSIFMMAIPISNFISGIMSSFIISHMNGVIGMTGWQWLYQKKKLKAVEDRNARLIIEIYN